ncbi:hypothetical protein VPNG_06071 [Cytospora leucostoma]|uniref:Uncharacterized protein n=1 Tax=Cytospora leucostoma TaxID=1230097 RepID=A0A423WX41_9PEZI|nr:hypothetical protein VPNG_06071 [Cytospora leucostoma]
MPSYAMDYVWTGQKQFSQRTWQQQTWQQPASAGTHGGGNTARRADLPGPEVDRTVPNILGIRCIATSTASPSSGFLQSHGRGQEHSFSAEIEKNEAREARECTFRNFKTRNASSAESARLLDKPKAQPQFREHRGHPWHKTRHAGAPKGPPPTPCDDPTSAPWRRRSTLDWLGNLLDDWWDEMFEPDNDVLESEDDEKDEIEQLSQQGGNPAAPSPSTKEAPDAQAPQGGGQQLVPSPRQLFQQDNNAVSPTGAFGSLTVDGSATPSYTAVRTEEHAPEPSRSADEPWSGNEALKTLRQTMEFAEIAYEGRAACLEEAKRWKGRAPEPSSSSGKPWPDGEMFRRLRQKMKVAEVAFQDCVADLEEIKRWKERRQQGPSPDGAERREQPSSAGSSLPPPPLRVPQPRTTGLTPTSLDRLAGRCVTGPYACDARSTEAGAKQRSQGCGGIEAACCRQGGGPDDDIGTETPLNTGDCVGMKRKSPELPKRKATVVELTASDRDADLHDGDDGYFDSNFEEIELPEPEEPDEGWDDLGSEHAPRMASQNTSYPGPRRGFMSPCFRLPTMK